MDQSITTIKESLENLRYSTPNYESRYFFPEGSLLELLSDSTVKSALQTLPILRHEVPDLVKSIRRGARKCFAVLILIDRGELISNFFRHDSLRDSFPDDHLPYSEEALELIFGVERIEDASGNRRTHPWIMKFLEKQWEVAVPILQQHALFRKLDDKIILPFLSEEPAGTGSGGTVWKVHLHPKCHRLSLLQNDNVARKEITRDKIFQKELENISMLTHLEHPNIIRLHCSYIYKQRYNLILSFAQGGTLAQFLAGKSQAADSLQGSQLVCALADLSSALVALHNFTSQALDTSLLGCHHDLAPRNILIHDDKFLLADFGLSTLRNPEDGSLTTHKDVRGFYNAPESQAIQNDKLHSQKVRRASDIWSFGCILLEILTFMLRGSDGVSRFKNRRRANITDGTTWFRFHLGPNVESPAVKSWMEELREEAPESFQVWMIALISEMLQLDPNSRPSAERVFAALRAIFISSLAGAVEKRMDNDEDACSQTIDEMLNQMRYKSWLFAFNKLFETFMNTTGQQQPQKIDLLYETTLEALKQSSDILSSSSEGRADISTHQKSSLFRYQLVRLFDALPLQYRSVAKEHLTTLILTHGEPDILGEFSAAMSQGGDDDVGTLVAVKRLTALSEAGTLIEEPHLELDRNGIEYLKEVDIHELSTMDSGSKRVLVEWLKYKGQWADEINRRELAQRLASIVNLLHKDAVASIPGTLPCLGLFHEPSERAFGVVYELPAPTSDALTLGHLLSSSAYRPPLEDRFRLAKEICESIDTFHKIGWVHRNIHPFNVLFFPAEPVIKSESAKSPRIFGFAGSRESRLDSITLGPDKNDLRIYQHPDYLDGKTRYREEFDYYSIGLVLLEIGFWSTLTTLTNSTRFKGASPKKFREMIIERRVSELRKSMGKRYMEATEACLQGKFTAGPPEAGGGGATWNSSFKTLVIDRIPLID